MPPAVPAAAAMKTRARKWSTCGWGREDGGMRGWVWTKAGGEEHRTSERIARRSVTTGPRLATTTQHSQALTRLHTHTQSTGKCRHTYACGHGSSHPSPFRSFFRSSSPPPPFGSRRLPLYTKLARLPGLPPPLPPPPVPTLVPIRIDVDIGGIHLIDSFSIDPHDSSLTPEQWARQLCGDLELPAPQEFERRIAQSIR